MKLRIKDKIKLFLWKLLAWDLLGYNDSEIFSNGRDSLHMDLFDKKCKRVDYKTTNPFCPQDKRYWDFVETTSKALFIKLGYLPENCVLEHHKDWEYETPNYSRCI